MFTTVEAGQGEKKEYQERVWGCDVCEVDLEQRFSAGVDFSALNL